MRTKQIDFTIISAAVGSGVEIIFARPEPCKVVRVYPLPEIYKELGLETDIKKVLDQTATFKKFGAWFYFPADRDMALYAMQYLFDNLQVPAFLVEPPTMYGQDENDNPVKEILN